MSNINKVAQNANTTANVHDTLTAYELAYANGNYLVELQALAQMVSYSTLGKHLDPQRKTAINKAGTVTKDGMYVSSNNGNNKLLQAIKSNIYRDTKMLENTVTNANNATTHEYSKDGELVEVVLDNKANEGLADNLSNSVSDSMDIVQEAILAILDMSDKYGYCPHWLTTPLHLRKLSRRVKTDIAQRKAYTYEYVTPIQLVYRHVSAYLRSQQGVRIDPTNGYTYISDQDELDAVYLRAGKYADIGGYTLDGLHTATAEDASKYRDLLEKVRKLNLTDRQKAIITYRLHGYSYRQIADVYGVTHNAIINAFTKIREKFTNSGIAPNMA